MAIKGIILGTCGLLLSFTAFAQDANVSKYHSCSAHAAKGTVALTFDDGPSVFTKKVLHILDHYHIKATFFVIGENAKHHPQFLKQVVADGNVIGNHTLSHPMVSKLSGEQLEKEVNEPEQIIYNIIGIKPEIFRFPYGGENKRVRQYVQSQGLIPVHWGYSSEDYRRPGSGVIAKRVISHAQSGQVILLHDGPAHREQTVAALPKIIEGIKKKGLGFSVLCS